MPVLRVMLWEADRGAGLHMYASKLRPRPVLPGSQASEKQRSSLVLRAKGKIVSFPWGRFYSSADTTRVLLCRASGDLACARLILGHSARC